MALQAQCWRQNQANSTTWNEIKTRPHQETSWSEFKLVWDEHKPKFCNWTLYGLRTAARQHHITYLMLTPAVWLRSCRWKHWTPEVQVLSNAIDKCNQIEKPHRVTPLKKRRCVCNDYVMKSNFGLALPYECPSLEPSLNWNVVMDFGNCFDFCSMEHFGRAIECSMSCCMFLSWKLSHYPKRSQFLRVFHDGVPPHTPISGQYLGWQLPANFRCHRTRYNLYTRKIGTHEFNRFSENFATAANWSRMGERDGVGFS